MITITDKDCDGRNELYCEWYVCPVCGTSDISEFFKHCPGCGQLINWDVKND